MKSTTDLKEDSRDEFYQGFLDVYKNVIKKYGKSREEIYQKLKKDLSGLLEVEVLRIRNLLLRRKNVISTYYQRSSSAILKFLVDNKIPEEDRSDLLYYLFLIKSGKMEQLLNFVKGSPKYEGDVEVSSELRKIEDSFATNDNYRYSAYKYHPVMNILLGIRYFGVESDEASDENLFYLSTLLFDESLDKFIFRKNFIDLKNRSNLSVLGTWDVDSINNANNNFNERSVGTGLCNGQIPVVSNKKSVVLKELSVDDWNGLFLFDERIDEDLDYNFHVAELIIGLISVDKFLEFLSYRIFEVLNNYPSYLFDVLFNDSFESENLSKFKKLQNCSEIPNSFKSD